MKTLLRLNLILFVSLFSLNASFAQSEPEEVLNHVLLFKWKAETPADTIEMATGILKGMPEKIDGFSKIEFFDTSFSSDEFNIVIIGQYDSEAALKNYEEHEDHKKFLEVAGPHIEKYSVNDFWSKE